jgi:hypothetical protein
MNFPATRSLVLAIGLAAFGCDNKSNKNLAPTASALASAEKPSETARELAIETSGSKVTFLMHAPIEQITGEADDAVSGQVFVDLMNLKKTTALIKVDLDKLVLYQQKREDDKSEFGERKKNDLQNHHARAWLEISDDAPAAEREKNRWAEYKIDKVLEVSNPDVTKLTGADRKVTATVEGDFRLHQRKTRKTAKIEATFKFDGDNLSSVTIKTVEPLAIGLEEHDVKPRELFGKLAQKTLSDLGQKVAKDAPVTIELTAKPK